MSTRLQTIATGFRFPEGPRWHEGAFWFSDQHDGLVHRLSPAGARLESFAVPGDPSGLGWLPDGDLLVVSMHERRVYRRRGARLEPWAELGALHPGLSNDMVVDAAGRAWVGNIGFDFHAGEAPRPTALALVRPDGSVALAADGLVCPNGSVVTPDGRTLIVAESLAFRLHAWSIGADGALGAHRVFAEFPAQHVPDGICLVAEGCVWIASPTTGVLLRVREGGEVLDSIPVGDGNPYACMLGGEDRRTLYVCVAATHDTAETARERRGRIDVARVAVPGAGLP